MVQFKDSPFTYFITFLGYQTSFFRLYDSFFVADYLLGTCSHIIQITGGLHGELAIYVGAVLGQLLHLDLSLLYLRKVTC